MDIHRKLRLANLMAVACGLVLAFWVFLLIIGCSDNNSAKPVEAQITPTQQLTIIISMYNRIYADSMVMVGYEQLDGGAWVKTSDPELTDAEKEIYNKKKEVLKAAWPLIRTYDQYVIAGNAATPAMTIELLDLLNSVLE